MSRQFQVGIALLLVLAMISSFGLDHPVARLAATAGPSVLALFRFITWFGQGGVVLWPCGIALLAAFWLRPRLPSLAEPLKSLIHRASLLFVAVAVAGLVNDTIKIIFGRARPRLWLDGNVSGFYFFRFGSDYASFPSGHTATSVAAAIVLGTLFPRWRVGFALFALLIAISRIVLDAHYVSDVIAGAAVGAASATALMAWLESRNWWAKTAPQKASDAVVR